MQHVRNPMHQIVVLNARLINIVNDCQAKQHWMKGGHKQRCNKAEENSQNGGKAIARGLIQNYTADPLVQNFFSYFDSVAKLGGCFVG